MNEKTSSLRGILVYVIHINTRFESMANNLISYAGTYANTLKNRMFKPTPAKLK